MTYLRCDNAGENHDLEGHASRKRWAFSLSVTCQVLHNKIVKLNGNLLLYLIGYVQSSMMGFFLRNDLWGKAVNTATLLEIFMLTPTRDLRTFQPLFWKKKTLA